MRLLPVIVLLLGCGDDAASHPDGSTDGMVTPDASTDAAPIGDNPVTCQQAAMVKTHLGCDFWPTVVPNPVWSIFDFAVVVVNPGTSAASVRVERSGATVTTATVQAGASQILYLPWVPELKGPDRSATGAVPAYSQSVLATMGAFHLVASVPVSAYQFSPIEWEGQGGPPGKDWSSCPGPTVGLPCNSSGGDASLLLPTTSLTGSYRVAGIGGWPTANIGSYLAITATQDGTHVSLSLSPTGSIAAGTGISAIAAGGSGTVTLNGGDVAVLLGPVDGDLSGSLVLADKPIQVIFGHPCRDVPDDQGFCDHVEESLPPAETLGRHYLVVQPLGPSGTPVPQLVRIVGNFDGTSLTYPSGAPGGAPLSINAGQVIDLGMVNIDFEVQGDHAFAVTTFMLGSTLVDPSPPPPGGARGDPSQTVVAPVEQYRKSYVLPVPGDFAPSFVTVTQPLSASLLLDGAASPVSPVMIGTGSYGVARIPLTPGIHTLAASAPVGIQVGGYGTAASYAHPGAFDLSAISPAR